MEVYNFWRLEAAGAGWWRHTGTTCTNMHALTIKTTEKLGLQHTEAA